MCPRAFPPLSLPHAWLQLTGPILGLIGTFLVIVIITLLPFMLYYVFVHWCRCVVSLISPARADSNSGSVRPSHRPGAHIVFDQLSYSVILSKGACGRRKKTIRVLDEV